MRLVIARLATALFLAMIPSGAHAGVIEDAIAGRMERLQDQGSLAIGSTSIAATAILPELYERRGFRPAWNAPGRLDALIGAIEGVAQDGLLPADYHLAELRELRGRANDEGEAADLDLLATDAFACLAYHLHFGKVDPSRLDSRWNFTRTLDRKEAVGVLLGSIDTGHITALLDRLRPQQTLYQDLRRSLAAHRDIAARGGWPKLATGKAIGAGARDPRVPILRVRLAASGDLRLASSGNVRSADVDTSVVFDSALERALRAFQRRHLLAEDGALGPATLAALNVPVEDRIDQLLVNLERARWLLQQLPDSFIVVNVAGYETSLISGSQRVWTGRCQVGQQGRQTPIFRAEMRYLVFNPTWTVPNGILSRDILPPLQRGDLDVLRRKKLNVLDAKGRRVAPGSVNWSKVSARGCPYTFRQDAGPDNALGRVKFMFPNSYSVYLHDTPSRDLFEAPTRAFSSGCIRVQHPLELAERVLSDPKWSAAAIEKVVKSGTTTTVQLRRPLPVLLLYWTAFPMAGHEVAFAPDIYKRDGRVLDALRGPVRPSAKPVAGG